MDAFVGEIRPFGFSFAPRGWMACNGQLLPIQSYTALFSIIGTYYGGNGTTNFQLPNIQGAVLNGQGQLTGGSQYVIGEVGGSTGVTLLTTEIPSHTHTMDGAVSTSTTASVTTPSSSTYISNSFTIQKPGDTVGLVGHSYASSAATPPPVLATLNPTTVGLTGSNLPHNNMAPFLAIGYCICISGIFPTRN